MYEAAKNIFALIGLLCVTSSFLMILFILLQGIRGKFRNSPSPESRKVPHLK